MKAYRIKKPKPNKVKVNVIVKNDQGDVFVPEGLSEAALKFVPLRSPKIPLSLLTNVHPLQKGFVEFTFEGKL